MIIKKAKQLVKENRIIKPLEKMKLWSKIERINGTELEEMIQELKKIEKKKKKSSYTGIKAFGWFFGYYRDSSKTVIGFIKTRRDL
jgi:hypothetical protein